MMVVSYLFIDEVGLVASPLPYYLGCCWATV
jgi:hypothetical protein